MPVQKLRPTYKFNEEQLKQLREIAPEAFKDNLLDFNALYEALADEIADDDLDIEHYGLQWPGKRDAKKMVTATSKGTLMPDVARSLNWGKASNIFIEGENLETLKIILKAYVGKAKMIYIDPPYNTGEDFIYDDDFSESLEEYLRRTKQVDEQGKPLTTNTRADGRFHSKWLSMMYPRLKLAHSLLKSEGVLFVSIDDNEIFNLRILLNEIFGEENFVAEIIRQSIKGGTGSNNSLRKNHDYVLMFAKSKDTLILGGIAQGNVVLDKTDDKGKYRKGRELNKWGAGSRREDSPTMWFPIPGPNGEDVYPIRNDGSEGRWRWGKTKLLKAAAEGDVIFEQRDNGTYIAYQKIRKEGPTTKTYSTLFLDKYLNSSGTDELKKLYSNKSLFDYPKPTSLIDELLQLVSPEDGDIIIDFFAGSSTTAHSVLKYNAANDEQLRFLMVQLPLEIEESKEAYKAGFRKLSDLSFDRISRVIAEIKKENTDIDLGVRFYKLWYSNFKTWSNYTGNDVKQLETLFSKHESSLVESWSQENLLTEILLMEGFPLDSTIKPLERYKKNTIQEITSDFCEHSLFVCLDKKIANETVGELELNDNDIFICLDTAVTDQDKARLDDKGLIKTI